MSGAPAVMAGSVFHPLNAVAAAHALPPGGSAVSPAGTAVGGASSQIAARPAPAAAISALVSGGARSRAALTPDTSSLAEPFLSPSWTAQVPAAAPSARAYAATAFDSVRNQTVLFGGYGSGSMLGDTYTWNGTTWTQQHPVHSPPARDVAYMAFDAAQGVTVLYGGFNGTNVLNDTWTWNGTDWTQQSPATSPGARAQGAAAYLPSTGKVYLFGGAGNLTDTWAWNETTWAQVATSGPQGRSSNSMTFDAAGGKLLMFGGDTSSSSALNDTWTFDGTSWSQVAAPNPPAALDGASLVYDAVLQRPILVGGEDSNGNFVSSVYAFDETDWRGASIEMSLTARAYAAVSVSPANGQLVAFGGQATAGALLGDTQTYDWPQLGQQASYTELPFRLTDGQSLSVNPVTGNVSLAATDLTVAGAGQNLTISRQYNSQALIPLTEGASWGFNGPPDEYETTGLGTGDASMIGVAGGNTISWFKRNPSTGALTTPAGLDASLVDNGNGLTLTDNSSQRKITFGPGVNTEQSDASRNGETNTYGYTNNELSTITDSEGRTYTVSQNTAGQTSKIVDNAGGRSVSYGYTGGLLTTVSDPAGATTTYGYNAANELSTITTPAGREVTLTYDAFRRVTGVEQVTNTSNGAGYTTAFTYSPALTTDTASATIRTLVVQPDQQGSSTGTTYVGNHLGQVLTAIDALGHTRSSTYTADAQPQNLTDTSNNVTTLSYDSLNNLNSVQAPSSGSTAGRTAKLGYPTPSGSGPYPGADYQPTSSTDPQNNQTTYSYDTTGNLTSSTLPSSIGAHLTNTYQGDSGVSCAAKPGQLCSSVDARGLTTTYSYDTSGNLAKITPPAPIGATTLTVDADSRIRTVTDGRAIATVYTYDSDGRIVQIRDDGSTSATCSSSDAAASKCVSYTYDADGNLTNRLDATGAWTFSYDPVGRLAGETTPASAAGITSQVLTYDASGNLTSFQDGSVPVKYYYNAANQLSMLAEPYDSCSPGETVPNADDCTLFGYNAAGQRTTTSYPTGEVVTVGYDTSGRETSVVAKRPGGATIVSRTYVYTTGSGATDTDLRQSVTDQTGVKTSYTYDALNRLKTAVTGTSTLGYTYDNDGNLTQATKTGASTTYYGYNNSNELCWSGSTSGSNGTSTCPSTPSGDSGYTYDGDGNRLTGGGITAVYNKFNQPTSVTAGGVTTSMTYADVGSRLRTSVGTNDVENTPLGVSRLDNGTPNSTAITRDPNGNLISLRNQGTSSYYTLDALGSVLALTDSTGNTDTASYTYNPYGQTTSTTGSQTSLNPFGYAGGYTDPSGQIHFGQRYYQPTTATWTQQDSLSQINDPTQADRYTYSGDNPLNNEDLSGAQVCNGALHS
jgi:RHS repeat-associated protein